MLCIFCLTHCSVSAFVLDSATTSIETHQTVVATISSFFSHLLKKETHLKLSQIKVHYLYIEKTALCMYCN